MNEKNIAPGPVCDSKDDSKASPTVEELQVQMSSSFLHELVSSFYHGAVSRILHKLVGNILRHMVSSILHR